LRCVNLKKGSTALQSSRKSELAPINDLACRNSEHRSGVNPQFVTPLADIAFLARVVGSMAAFAGALAFYSWYAR
jgi:hypothetical protein